jgi:plastocyanin
MNLKLLTIPLAAAALALGACGDDNKDDSSSGGGGAATQSTEQTPPPTTETPSGGAPAGGKLTVDADPGGALKFTKDTLQAKAGKVTIVMNNPSSVPHAIGVEGKGVDEDGDTVQQGGTSTVTVDLKPGEYEFYCPVDGHKEAGMEGKLTVK